MGPWDIPDTWVWSTTGEVAQVVGGGTPRTVDSANYADGDIPWITPADLSGYSEKHISRGARCITRVGLENSGARLMPAGSVLFSSRAPIGYVAIASNELSTNQGFKSFVPASGVLPDYLYYYLQRAKELAVALASGTTFLEISGAKAAKIPLALAPGREQRRIVAEIEKQFTRLDAAVAALKRVQANLKRYRAAVLKAACEGRLVPTEAELARKEGRPYEPADQLLARILQERRAKWEADQLARMLAAGKHPRDDSWKRKYKEPGPPDTANLPALPEGWTWARAEQVCDFITKGTTPAAHRLYAGVGQVPYIKVYNLTDDGRLAFDINPTFIDRSTHLGELARSRVLPGDVLMNIVGPPLGKVSVVPDLFPEWNTNQAVAIFRPIAGLERRFLCLLLLCEDVLRWAKQRAKATAGQFNLTLEICRDLPLPIPPAAEQARIVAEAEDRLSVGDAVAKSIAADVVRADRLRQSILKRAFEGRLVPQDPNDEPASVMLERIRAERSTASNDSAVTTNSKHLRQEGRRQTVPALK